MTTAISKITSFVYNTLNEKKLQLALYFDLRRAVDNIGYNLLFDKLERVRMGGQSYKFL